MAKVINAYEFGITESSREEGREIIAFSVSETEEKKLCTMTFYRKNGEWISYVMDGTKDPDIEICNIGDKYIFHAYSTYSRFEQWGSRVMAYNKEWEKSNCNSGEEWWHWQIDSLNHLYVNDSFYWHVSEILENVSKEKITLEWADLLNKSGFPKAVAEIEKSYRKQKYLRLKAYGMYLWDYDFLEEYVEPVGETTNFYEGDIYPVWMELYHPEAMKRKYSFNILDVKDDKQHEKAYVLLGLGRGLEVKDNAIFIFNKGIRSRTYHNIFEEKDGRLVFDLPGWLARHNVPFQSNGYWKWKEHLAKVIVCDNGEIYWGEDKYPNYHVGTLVFQKNVLKLEDEYVAEINFDEISEMVNIKELKKWMREALKKQTTITRKELKELFNKWNIGKSEGILIRLRNGQTIAGYQVREWNL